MTRIDPSRIAEIFRTLASERSEPVKHAKSDTGQSTKTANVTQKVKNHDEDVLRQRLRKRLKRLSEEDGDFSALAPEVTVKEVLIWEFGDNILNHPEFNHISHKITQAMLMNENISLHLQKLIRQMLEQ